MRDYTAEERTLINGGIVTDALLLAQTGAKQPAGEAGFTTAERISIRPTFEIHGMPGGYTDTGKKSVIPAVAKAKISTRLVPEQDPTEVARLFDAYLRRLAPPGVEVDIVLQAISYPVEMRIDTHAIKAAERAYLAVFGRGPVYMRGGGSLPFTYDIQHTLGAAIVMMGMGLPDDNLHAPNEKMHLPNFYNGIETIIHYFAELAADRLSPEQRRDNSGK